MARRFTTITALTPKRVGRFVGVLALSWLFISALILFVSLKSISDFLIHISPKSFLTHTTILVLGLDVTDGVSRSDTMMLIQLDSRQNFVRVLSIPRDTRVTVPGLGTTKINSAYAQGKSPLALRAVSELLGVPITHIVVLNLANVASIVDRLGGVRLTLKKPMHYTDNAGQLFINLPSGPQTLSGDQALQYLRFRHDVNGDIGRIDRQQAFLMAVVHQFTSFTALLKLPILAFDLYRFIDTDMTFREIVGLAQQLQGVLRYGRIDTKTLPGTPQDIGGVSYWIADTSAVNQLLDIPTAPETPSVMTPSPTPAPPTVVAAADSESSSDTDSRAIRIEILNGYGAPMLAQDAASLIAPLPHIQIAHTGNAGQGHYPQTMIVDWKGNIEKVLFLANSLGIDPAQIIVYDRPEKQVDATLILGKDWPLIRAKIHAKGSRAPIQ